MLLWRSKSKFYACQLERDLFGELSLRIKHGGRANHLVQERTLHCENVMVARKELRKIFKVRRAHGYQLFGG